MKDWMKIGEFALKTGLSARALRIYEQMGLVQSQKRGDNDYRYYRADQLKSVARIRELKDLGFALKDIQQLTAADRQVAPDRLLQFFKAQQHKVSELHGKTAEQLKRIDSILRTLEKPEPKLGPDDQKFILRHFQEIVIVVTGTVGLERTAQMIQSHLAQAGHRLEISNTLSVKTRGQIFCIHEKNLDDPILKNLKPDVVVIKELSEFNPRTEKRFAKLFAHAGPQLSTVLNADDRASVALAASPQIRKGRTFYFSKNKGLEKQIRRIGGLVSNGEELRIYGFNARPGQMKLRLPRIFGIAEETSVMASLVAVLDLGLRKQDMSNFETWAALPQP